ncbi:MAG: rRNA adenine dimethyltransferase family protein, partial [Candidatus Uhrbacteria bacterium]|nr:rRNA adenine dimethyltransferase family protein [Candidatus Uhrbacteria bacterium]
MQKKKSFGQHFLHDKKIVEKIVKSAELSSVDFIVEVGPGEGAMTKEIVDSPPFKGGVMGGSGKTQLILIEADQDLIPGLESKFTNAKIIQADAAKVDYTKLVPKKKSWMLVGNLPYNAGNAIIMNALASERPPLRLVVMVQKEVADRML